MRVSHAAKREAWRDRLSRRSVSRLSLAEFCRQEHVSVKSFYYWKRRLSVVTAASQPSAFLPVRIAPTGPSHVEIELPNRSVVRVPMELAHERLTELIQAAAAAPAPRAEAPTTGNQRC
jgi:hypothetical protein